MDRDSHTGAVVSGRQTEACWHRELFQGNLGLFLGTSDSTVETQGALGTLCGWVCEPSPLFAANMLAEWPKNISFGSKLLVAAPALHTTVASLPSLLPEPAVAFSYREDAGCRREGRQGESGRLRCPPLAHSVYPRLLPPPHFPS